MIIYWKIEVIEKNYLIKNLLIILLKLYCNKILIIIKLIFKAHINKYCFYINFLKNNNL